MPNTWDFNKQFANEFKNYPNDQQDKIIEFVSNFKKYGLGDFTKYEGKLTPSWQGLPVSDPIHNYAKLNSLWHYHIGIPNYKSRNPKYKTSDWVLHFQWTGKGSHISLVDICYHYKVDGSFHLPDPRYLTK